MTVRHESAMRAKKFRKKPVEVFAFECREVMFIETLEGDMRADDGDFVITGVNGEMYPCKPEIFKKTYEAVEGGK